MNRETFNRGLLALSHAFGREATPAMLEAFWIALRDLPDAAYLAAAERALKTERFWPSPAVLRDHALGGVQADDGSEILALVERAFRRVGAYRSIDFGDPAINAAVRILGGWPALCALNAEEWTAFRSKELVKHALHFRRYGPPVDLKGHLPGLEEKSNVRAGEAPPIPISMAPRIALPSGEDT